LSKKPSSLPPHLREEAEAQLAHAAPNNVPVRSAVELLQELQVHQIELEMQNDALRETQLALEESRDRYVDLYEFAPVGYLTLSREAKIVEINLTGATLLGEERKKLLERRFSSFVLPRDQDRWHRHFAHALQHDGRQTCELKLLHSDRGAFDAGLDCLHTKTSDGRSTLRVSLSNITARKQAEAELRIAAIAFESQEGIIVTDPDGVIVRVNRAFTVLTGYPAEEAIGNTPELFSAGRHDKAFHQKRAQILKESGYWQGERWIRTRNGKIFAAWQTMTAVTAARGSVTHYVGTFSDITPNKEVEAAVRRLAYYDALTRLPNRRLLHDRISHALAGSYRSHQYGAILFLDLDNFKNLNDSHGHEAGDLLLVETARRLQANVREGDTVARLGGDEFVVVLEGLSIDAREAAVQARMVAEKIREALARPCNLAGREVRCTTSFGVALFHGHDERAEALLKHADLAMYKAKSAGRNTLRFFDPAMQIALDERGALEADLRLAVERGQLELHFQAQFDSTRRVIGAEALLRWRHPERGMVPPAEFIPLAEATGLIVPVGHWALTTACTQMAAWSRAPATRALRIAVNVSTMQFRQPEFVAQVTEALALAAVEPARLKIELTEGVVIEDLADTIARMRALKARGIGFSMDDFGTGFSSLSNLKRLPLDEVKIDQAFVRDLASDSTDAAIVQTIVTMGQILGLNVIAEGVETEAQLQRLIEFGCAAYQGTLFAAPLPAAAFEDLVRQTQGSR